MSRSPRKTKRFRYRQDIVVFTPTSDDITLAHERSCRLGVLPTSYMRGIGRMTGFMGEIAINAYLPRSKYVGDKEMTHDLVYKKQLVEVKSKMCSKQPEPHYSAFVNCEEGEEKQNDVIFFTRVRRDYQRVYIVGWMPTGLFYDQADYVRKGERDGTGYVFRSPGYNIAISRLNTPLSFKKG